MILSNEFLKKAGAGVVAGVIVTLAMLPKANAELVYDDEREVTRSVMQTAEKAKASAGTVEITPASGAPVSVTTKVINTSNSESTAAVENMTRSELLRRERQREELKNEDILQTRLEELRLRDEKRRVDTVLGQGEAAEEVSAMPKRAAVPEVTVIRSVGENSGDVVVSSAAAPAAGTLVTAAPTAVPSESSDRARISISPRGGLSNLVTGSNYGATPRFSLGGAIGLGVTDQIEIEAGYTYSEFGLRMASSNPFVQWAQSYNRMNLANSDTLVLKQNLIDLGIKFYVLGSDSRFRPFVMGGGAYARSFLNYSQQIQTSLAQTGMSQFTGNDYTLNQYMGYVGGGADFRITKNITIGAMFRYYGVLASNENQPLNNAAFYGQTGAYSPYGYPAYSTAYGYPGYSTAYGATAADADKQIVGGSLSRVGFYSVLAGLSFTF